MTDDEVLAIIDRRLAEVEARLPPRPLEAAGRRPVPGHGVVARLGADARPGLVVAAVVAVAVFGLLGFRPGAAPGMAGWSTSPVAPASSTSQSEPPRPTTSSDRSESTAPTQASIDGLEVLHGDVDASELIRSRAGWTGCISMADVLIALPDLAGIDAAAGAAGIDEGWVDVPEIGRVFVGPSVERAAIALGASVLASGGRGDTWIRIGGAAHQLVGFKTPAGLLYWRTTSSMRPCTPEPEDPR